MIVSQFDKDNQVILDLFKHGVQLTLDEILNFGRKALHCPYSRKWFIEHIRYLRQNDKIYYNRFTRKYKKKTIHEDSLYKLSTIHH